MQICKKKKKNSKSKHKHPIFSLGQFESRETYSGVLITLQMISRKK